METQVKDKFTREQLIFIVEAALVAAVDRIESGMPTSGLTWEERLEYVNGVDRHAGSLTAYDRGALESAGMTIAILYAQCTDDGIGIGDALATAGKFCKAVKEWVEKTWEDEGKHVHEQIKRLGNGGWQIKDAYTNYPDCRKHAEIYVDTLFGQYWKDR